MIKGMRVKTRLSILRFYISKIKVRQREIVMFSIFLGKVRERTTEKEKTQKKKTKCKMKEM
jgi:hypothetical protein